MDYQKLYAIKHENQMRIMKACPNCPNTSGIYFLTRVEDDIKYAYVGKAKHLLERLGDHLAGHQQHIDRSIKKHGLWSADNITGWKVNVLEFKEEELDERERYFIKMYAKAGFQLRNVESGGTTGKTDIGERKPSRGYYDGLEQGKKNARKFVSYLFTKHLDYKPKSDKPSKNQEKAMKKFKEYIESDDEVSQGS